MRTGAGEQFIRWAKVHAVVALGALLATSACTSSSLARSEYVETRSANLSELDALARSLVDEGATAGVSWAIRIGREPARARTYGVSYIQTKRALRSSDRFRIASVTKPVTAAAVLSLVQSGRLSLETRLAKFFPEYPNGQRITVHQLLSHTSGIPNWWEGQLPKGTPNDFPMCAEPHRYLQQMQIASLFEPGSAYKYSNTGYVLLGEIIEKASGQSYEDFLRDAVFAPARMKATELERDENASAFWIHGYAREPATNAFVPPTVYAMPFAAGGLRSTASDVLFFMDALFSGTMLDRDLLQQMTSYARLNDGRMTFEAPFIPPGSPPKPVDHVTKRGYGYGFNLMELDGTPVYYHSGGIAGFNAYVLHIPRNEVTLVLLANTEDGLMPALKDILSVASEIL